MGVGVAYAGPTKSELAPDGDAIMRHVEFWLGGLMTGFVQVGWMNPNTANLTQFQTFEVTAYDEMAEFIEATNAVPGQSIYMRLALLKADLGTKAASDTDFLCAPGAWCDIDREGGADEAPNIYSTCRPNVAVVTGRTPYKRVQFGWKLSEPTFNGDGIKHLNQRICTRLGGDPAAVNPTRLMRIGGTLAWPYKAGRIVERTETVLFQDRPRFYPIHTIGLSFPVEEQQRQQSTGQPPAGLTTLGSMAPEGKTRQLISNALNDRNWHNSVVALASRLKGKGRTDEEIMLMSAGLTRPGFTVQDTMQELQGAIESAKLKYGFTSDDDDNVDPLLVDMDFAPTPWVAMDPTKIPPREWLFGDILARRFVSVLVAPPGVGKSILTIEAAVSIALKMDLGPFKAHEQTKVWLFNNEDPRDELNRRISAFAIASGINAERLNGHLFVDTGEEKHLMVAAYDENRNVIRMPVVERMVEHIQRHGIGLLIVDPFIETHGVNENSNNDINLVARLYREIAQRTGCAVWLVHHTRKTPAGAIASAPGDSDAGRGASALGGVARFTATLFNMSKEDAKALNVPEEERYLYVRFDDGKANLKLKNGAGIWWRKRSVSLENAQGFRPADSMGVLEWVDMDGLMDAASERRREQWDVIGVALCTQMEGGQEITLNNAVRLVKVAAANVGIVSDRSVARFLLDVLAMPKNVGAWRISHVKEQRGNGTNWIKKEEAPTWDR